MTSGEPSLEQLIGRAGPPPLRIHHIFVATAVTAMLLSVNEVLRQNDVYALGKYLASGRGIVMTITTGIAATLVMYGITWRRAGLAFFDQPGHWLLLQQALTVGVFVFAAIGGAVQLAGGEIDYSLPVGLYFLLMQFGWVGVSFWAAWRIADSIAWKLLFLLDGCMILCIFGAQFLGLHVFSILIVNGGQFVTLVVSLIAVAGDRRAARPRDWPHWMGVFLRLTAYAVVLALLLSSWLATSGWSLDPSQGGA